MLANVAVDRTAKRMPKTARRQGGPGIPFVKGQSGNPAGRPPRSPEQRVIDIDVRAYAKGFGREAIDKVVALMRGQAVVGHDRNGVPIHGTCSAPTQLEAARYLYDQGYGKAMQAVAVNSNQVVEHAVRDDLDERLESRIALIRERLRAQGVLPPLR